MNLRELIEPIPALAQLGVRGLARKRMDIATVATRSQLLFCQWERELEWDQSGCPELAEEIICTEALTVLSSAIVLAAHPDQVFAPPGEAVRRTASRHAELRDRALEWVEQHSPDPWSAMTTRRLRQQMSRWIDRLIRPHVDAIGADGPGGNGPEALHQLPVTPARVALETAALLKAVPSRRIDHPYRAALLRSIASHVIGWFDETQLPFRGAWRPATDRQDRARFFRDL